MKTSSLRVASIALLVLLLASVASARNATTQFLTGPQNGAPMDIALSYLESQLGALGLAAQDLDGYTVSSTYQSRHNGVTHIYLQQRLDGIEVMGAMIVMNVAEDGSIINLHNDFLPGLAARSSLRSPVLAADDALGRAAAHLGLPTPTQRLPLSVQGGDELARTFAAQGISTSDIPARLRYIPTDDGAVRLVWALEIEVPGSPDWWVMGIDAETGEVISKLNRTQDVHKGAEGDTYLVFPIPGENPDDIAQTLVVDPADPTASPFGWHDTDGIAGAEFLDTRGNNVEAQEDVDANNLGGTRPSGGASEPLVFSFAFDDMTDPDTPTNQSAAIVNLFYWSNVMHDLTYHYGFDEPAGNFQTNNYGNGGIAGDPVQADAQDGSSTNNATFGTPPDGFDPRMTMFLWIPPAAVTINSPGGIAGDYSAGGASFGAVLDGTGITADFSLVDDGTGTTSDACEAVQNDLTGTIALIDRGSCEFGLKVLNAENAGAIGAIVINNAGDGVISMGPGANGGSVTIPSAFVGQTDGTSFKNNLPVNGTIKLLSPVFRDSDFDNGVIAHEYGHGISNRLTGGPNTTSCLGGDEQAGEGWSDFWTLVLFAKDTDTEATTRGVGNYLQFQDENGLGIRNFPYSTDLVTNPQVYSDIGATNVPHGVGEIFANAVWEMYWELVNKHGFDSDLYNGTGGNNLTIQLVMDGMKLQPCNPTFVDARDAILMADMVNNSGENECEIWRAFAKRGLGVTADDGGGTTVGNEVDNFDVPAACSTTIFTDGFESGDTTSWSVVVQ